MVLQVAKQRGNRKPKTFVLIAVELESAKKSGSFEGGQVPFAAVFPRTVAQLFPENPPPIKARDHPTPAGCLEGEQFGAVGF